MKYLSSQPAGCKAKTTFFSRAYCRHHVFQLLKMCLKKPVCKVLQTVFDSERSIKYCNALSWFCILVCRWEWASCPVIVLESKEFCALCDLFRELDALCPRRSDNAEVTCCGSFLKSICYLCCYEKRIVCLSLAWNWQKINGRVWCFEGSLKFWGPCYSQELSCESQVTFSVE